MIDLNALRALAEKATPGPWAEDDGFISSGELPPCFDYVAWTGPYTGGEPDSALAQLEANGAYIAAANPQTIIALLDRITSLELALAGRQARIGELGMRLASTDAVAGNVVDDLGREEV